MLGAEGHGQGRAQGCSIPRLLAPREGLYNSKKHGQYLCLTNGCWLDCNKVKLVSSFSQKPSSYPQQTTLLDLMDALPSSGPAAQQAEPWGPSASANQTNPWGGPAAPASTSDPWPCGNDPLVCLSCMLVEWLRAAGQSCLLSLIWQRWEWVWPRVGAQAAALPLRTVGHTLFHSALNGFCFGGGKAAFLSASHVHQKWLVPPQGRVSSLSLRIAPSTQVNKL